MKPLLLHKTITLRKFPGKGGWTYAEIPKVVESKQPFGWVMVDAVIDSVEIKDMKLMAMKSGRLFLPVKASLRNKIRKEAGDKIEVKIFANIKIAE